jgi:hypothetical protein
VGGSHGIEEIMKRNKIRYKSEPVRRIEIILTGNIFLRYVDDDAIGSAKKGDVQVYAYNEALNGNRAGEYDSTGFSGYFKVDVFDGKKWCLILLNDIFPHQENHFSKKECPIDTYGLCREILEALTGRILLRTYREHYELESAAESEAAQD